MSMLSRRVRKGATRRQTTRASFDAAAAKVARAARAMGGTLGTALRGIGEEIMTDVKAASPGHGVPVDKGPLRASGRVEGPSALGPHKVRVTLSFGGASAPYALAQHEHLEYHHKVGEARYLVRGLERWQPGGSVAMAALRENMQTGLAIVGTA